jgi:hypothetical protein
MAIIDQAVTQRDLEGAGVIQRIASQSVRGVGLQRIEQRIAPAAVDDLGGDAVHLQRVVGVPAVEAVREQQLLIGAEHHHRRGRHAIHQQVQASSNFSIQLYWTSASNMWWNSSGGHPFKSMRGCRASPRRTANRGRHRAMSGAEEMDDIAPHRKTCVRPDRNAAPPPEEEVGDGLPNMQYRLRVICAAVLIGSAVWTAAFLLIR